MDVEVEKAVHAVLLQSAYSFLQPCHESELASRVLQHSPDLARVAPKDLYAALKSLPCLNADPANHTLSLKESYLPAFDTTPATPSSNTGAAAAYRLTHALSTAGASGTGKRIPFDIHEPATPR